MTIWSCNPGAKGAGSTIWTWECREWGAPEERERPLMREGEADVYDMRDARWALRRSWVDCECELFDVADGEGSGEVWWLGESAGEWPWECEKDESEP